jgi:apolipoprotein D and lipocalin family protein
MKLISFLIGIFMSLSCSSGNKYLNTVDRVDMDRFMTKWFVIAGRLTMFENGAHNAIESYTWNSAKNRIDIDFTMRVDGFDGKLKSIPQKGWIENTKTNAHWVISPMWPLRFNYLVIDLAEDYSWTVIGVPSQKWIWIMAKDWNMSDKTLDIIVQRINDLGYSTKDVKRVPQSW